MHTSRPDPWFRPAEAECEDWVASTATDRNNQQLEDAGAAHQQLSAADIEALRQKGRTGEEIVAALLENSATYSAKTQFSQVQLHYNRQTMPWLLIHAYVLLAQQVFCQIIHTGWHTAENIGAKRPGSMCSRS